MNSILKQIETEEYVIYTDHKFDDQFVKKCKDAFFIMKKEGMIKGDFEGRKWMLHSGLKWFGLKFEIDVFKYSNHIGKLMGIPLNKMELILKCYAMYCHGAFIYQTIAIKKINVLKSFLECFGDNDYFIKTPEMSTISDFLYFVSTPEEDIEKIVASIRHKKEKQRSQRALSPIINYLVIENEINNLYKSNLDDETFIKWFPIFFWVRITFILPLRATEMLITPFDCIEEKNGTYYLTIRRTRLKNVKRSVRYDVDKDYNLYTYSGIEENVINVIKRYIELTRNHSRRFLFDYEKNMINDMLSLSSFNNLLSSFTLEYLIGNPNYNYVKYAAGIDEFEPVTAGDSRPIAMTNLYFSEVGADICRQLAGHINIDTSASYFSNISETIQNESIMQVLKAINRGSETDINKLIERDAIIPGNRSICLSTKRAQESSNLDDCRDQGHLEECLGCKFFHPTKEYIKKYISKNKSESDKSSKLLVDFLNNIMSAKNHNYSIEELFLIAQRDATRLKMASDLQAKEKYKEWESV